MLVRFNGQGGETASRVVSKTPSYFGGKLAIGIPVPRDGGGMFLVATDGYYITLGPELERLDPLGVVDHLRARGSQNPDWDEVEHLYKLAWLLGGFPLCLLLGALAARLRKGRVVVGLTVGAGIFVLSGGVCFVQLLPLLA